MASRKDAEDRLRALLADRYRIEREIGRGGMAAVYLAEDLKHHRQVAVKVLDPELSESLGPSRFLKEIETAAKLTHPHILPLFDSGEAGGFLFFVMPYVKGESLRSRMEREKQLPAQDAVQIACEIADALAFAHEEGVIHRDVKPANILLESGHAVLADFGVAHALAEAKDERITQTGISLGTPSYMSPEQAAGERDLDGRSDQYALGCVLYEMLAGDPPFTGSTPVAILARQVNERLPSLSVVRPNLSPGLIKAVERALAKVPADRFRSPSDFANAIRRGLEEEKGIAPPRKGERRWRPRTSLALVGVMVAAAWFVWGRPSQVLDPNLLVVFPLEVSGQPRPDETGRGEDNAYLIWNALEGRGSLGWINAMHLIEDPEDLFRMSAAERRNLALDRGAGLYLHGRLMLSGDTAQAYLTLHEVGTDSIIARADTTAPRAEAGLLGVRAIGKLLFGLLPEETVDVSSIAGRKAEAIQTFVQAERHFHAGQFQRAFEDYAGAVALDSAFALAAVKGAQAAGWLHRAENAGDLIDLALEHRGTLTPRRRYFALGLEAFLASQADSAVRLFEQAIELDPEWPEAWTGLGEVYTHLLPRKSPPDSLAKDAFSRVYDRTAHSAPALFHLVEFTLREGDLGSASDLLEEYRGTDPDTAGYAMRKLELMSLCAKESPSAIDWKEHVRTDVGHVLEAARSLGVGGALPECAIAGFQAVLAHDTSVAGEPSRYAASVGLQSMLVATGRIEELTLLLDTTALYMEYLRPHYIIDALVGAPVEDKAEEQAERLRGSLPDLRDWEIWCLGVWEAHRGGLRAAKALRDTLLAWSQVNDRRRTDLVAASLSAHVALAEGDTSRAVRLLDALSPNVRRGSLYFPWESLGLERLFLAKIQLALGRYEEAYRIAALFDSPGAANLIYPAFLPASLEIRGEAARALGDEKAVQAIESRLRALEH